MAARMTALQVQYFDDAGAVLNGGTVFFYSPGTTTPKNIWDEPGKVNSRTRLVLDAAGRIQTGFFTEGLYDVVVRDSSGSKVGVTLSNWGDSASAVGTDLQNLIQNASFEINNSGDPANWSDAVNSGSPSSTRSTAAPAHGGAPPQAYYKYQLRRHTRPVCRI